MNIDVKKNKNKEKDFIAVEASNGFDVNRLSGIKNIESTYILNKANNVLTRKTESEIKQYFSKSKDELISILKKAKQARKPVLVHVLTQKGKGYLHIGTQLPGA